MFHGKGKFTDPDGKVYDGYWICGKREGHGEITWRDGKKFSGTFKDDRMDGPGIFTFRNGAPYVKMEANFEKGFVVIDR